MKPEQFAELAAQGYNRIPLVREFLADLDTPLSSYMKLASGPYSFILESIQGGETWGRYSIIGLPSKTVLTVRGRGVEVREDGAVTESHSVKNPLDFIDQYRQRFNVAPLEGMPAFHGGLVGYFGYDTVRFNESRLDDKSDTLTSKADPMGNPDIVLMLAEETVVFDILSGTLKVVVLCDPGRENAYQNGLERLDELSQQLRQTQIQAKVLSSTVDAQAPDMGEFKCLYEREDYEAAVETIREYILAGDCMQVVLSQRLTAPFHAAPIDLYRALRLLNPSPYMYYLNLNGLDIVGSSPEILARLQDDTVTVRPIAGTRKRGASEEQDQALEKELLADQKELAEHLMLIDLGRNDVGRIAATGSVKLTEQMIVERYSHVMHIVSKVTGQLSDAHGVIDVLKACLPAGTLSGAPKVRAMEIIDELEPVKRGIYGGAVGYISWSGEMDTAIAIRTAVIQNKTIHLQSGAGIVADSQPALEWEECMNKAKAVIKAVQLCS